MSIINNRFLSKVMLRHLDLTSAGLLPQLHHQPGSHDSPCITAYLWQLCVVWACVCEGMLLLLSSRSVWVEGWTPGEMCRWLLTQAPSPTMTGWWPVAQTSGRVQQRGTWHTGPGIVWIGEHYAINKWGLPPFHPFNLWRFSVGL